MKPSIGRIVHYKLSDWDAARINKRRKDFHVYNNSLNYRDTGYIAHFGNEVQRAEIVPLVITRVIGDHMVNGQALLDGSDTFWVTSAAEGESEGTWRWPSRD